MKISHKINSWKENIEKYCLETTFPLGVAGSSKEKSYREEEKKNSLKNAGINGKSSYS